MSLVECVFLLQVQRARLLKQVAIAYVARTVGKWMVDRFEQLQGKLDEAEDLQELAATSAGLKGHCTFLAAQGIEECRKCCGGNGYLLNRSRKILLQFSHCVFICNFPRNLFTLVGSGVGQLALDYLWQTTAEGDFVVMQVAFAQRACHRIFNPLTIFSHFFSVDRRKISHQISSQGSSRRPCQRPLRVHARSEQT
jgi:hypothetical protein